MPLVWCSSRASYRPPVKRGYNPISGGVRSASHSPAMAPRTLAAGGAAGSFRPASETDSNENSGSANLSAVFPHLFLTGA